MKLNRKSLVTLLSVVALVLIAGSAYFLRDRFFASGTGTGDKSFTVKVVNTGNEPVANAEVAIVFASPTDANTKKYLVDPVAGSTNLTQQFVTGGLSEVEKGLIKTNPLLEIVKPDVNNQMLDPFDESQTFEDYGYAWYNHHISSAGCVADPCFNSSLAVLRFTTVEDKGTDANGELEFKMKYLNGVMDRAYNNNWYVAKIYVKYNGQTSVLNLLDGQKLKTLVDTANSVKTVTIDSALRAVGGEAGIEVLVKNLKDQPVQGATVQLTMKCYADGEVAYNSDNDLTNKALLTLTTGANGIAKLTGTGWEDGIVMNLGPAGKTGCPTDKTADTQLVSGVTRSKSLTVSAYYSQTKIKNFEQHGPFAFDYNGSYADQLYVNTTPGACPDGATTCDPRSAGDTSPVITNFKVALGQNNIENGATSVLEYAAQNANSCKINGVALPNATSGSWTTPALTATTTYTLTCLGGNPEAPVEADTTVNVKAPKPVFVAPGLVSVLGATTPLAYNDHATLTWTATGATSCLIGGQTFQGETGTWTSAALTAPTNDFSVVCQNTSGSTTSTATVTVGIDPMTVGDTGNGLTLSFYNTWEQTGAAAEVINPAATTQPNSITNPQTINFYLPQSDPLPSNTYINYAPLSLRYEGFIKPPTSGDYKFYIANADDRARITIDGVVVSPATWWDHDSSNEGEWSTDYVYLDKGMTHTFRVDYYNGQGPGNMNLSWSSTNVSKEIIQQKYLYTSNPLASDTRCYINDKSAKVDGKYVIPDTCEYKSLVIAGVEVDAGAVLINGYSQRHFSNVALTSKAKVTYSALAAGENSTSEKKIDWIIAGDLTVNGGAQINVDSKGYKGGTVAIGGVCPTLGKGVPLDGEGPAGIGGGKASMWTPTTATKDDLAGSGGNGGRGGQWSVNGVIHWAGGPAYQTSSALALSMFEYGAGGGASYATNNGNTNNCYAGGAGGGRVRIDAGGTITVANGSAISANGGSSVAEKPNTGSNMMGGAGAGGTILLKAASYNLGTSASNGIGVLAGSTTNTSKLSAGMPGHEDGTSSVNITAKGGSSNPDLGYGDIATTGGGGVIVVQTK
ncbi:MAG: PA14 domain-containing protein [Candidatus Berkelbacteria bacterium]